MHEELECLVGRGLSENGEFHYYEFSLIKHVSGLYRPIFIALFYIQANTDNRSKVLLCLISIQFL